VLPLFYYKNGHSESLFKNRFNLMILAAMCLTMVCAQYPHRPLPPYGRVPPDFHHRYGPPPPPPYAHHHPYHQQHAEHPLEETGSSAGAAEEEPQDYQAECALVVPGLPGKSASIDRYAK
jgi:hypothetical protein